MNVEIKMPDLATTDSDVMIVRWLIEVGQQVQRGQPLLEIETDKATMEVESVASGTLRAVLAGAGDQVAVGQVIANIESEEMVKVAPIVVETKVTPEAMPIETEPSTPLIAPMPSTRQSLFARNKAKRGLTFTAVPDRLPLSANQREVGRRMLHSKQTIPHFYLTTSANAEGLAASREAFRQQNIKLAWDAFFVLAAARALQAFDKMMYRLEGDTLIRRSTTAIGVAVDIDDALYVIAVEEPLTSTLPDISRSIETKVAAIRQGDPAAKRMTETCLSITNLGAENIESFQAVINPPETAILAIGKVTPTVTAQGEQIVVQKRVALSLSVDHRVINGKYAAKFLSQLVKELEAI